MFFKFEGELFVLTFVFLCLDLSISRTVGYFVMAVLSI